MQKSAEGALDLAPQDAPAAPAVDVAGLLERSYPGLKSLIQRRVRDPQIAADLLQDAIVTGLAKLRAGEVRDPHLLGGFVYRIALNHLRNYNRKIRERQLDPSQRVDFAEDESPPAPARSESSQLASLVQQVLVDLPSLRDRELLVRFYLREEAKESVCQAMGLSDRHFDRVVFRARQRLRKLFEERGFRPSDLLQLFVFVGA
jgi:RNA polymerase sigma-70 factor (ECF subfamily)